jgi:DNA-directed RNA polymerase specialized sigma24 family protein
MVQSPKDIQMSRMISLPEEATLTNDRTLLLSIARRILKNYSTVAEDGEDVVQKVLTETLVKLRNGAVINDLSSYLRTGVANRAISLAKSLNRSRGIFFELDNGFEGYMISGTPHEQSDWFLEKELQFQHLKTQLSDKDRLVLDMLMEGFAPKAIAEILGVTMSCFYVMKHRLRRKFTYLLTEKKAAKGGRDGKSVK